MSKMKAVVLEKSGNRYTVLGNNGEFRYVHRRLNAEVGQEIEISSSLEMSRGIRFWVSFAALFLLVFSSFLGWNLYNVPTAVALLSVDINPTLQATLDAQGHLLKLQTENDDAKRILNQVNLTGKPLNEVMGQIITQAINQKYLNPQQNWVVVAFSPLSTAAANQIPPDLNEGRIKTLITETGEKKGLTPQVAVFALNPQEAELAKKEDLTIGEYALWQTAQKAGVATQPQKLKEPSERVKLLDNSKVQAQIVSQKKKSESDLRRLPGEGKQNPAFSMNTIENSIIDKFQNNRQDLNQRQPDSEEARGQDKGQGTEQDNSQDKGQGTEQARGQDKWQGTEQDNRRDKGQGKEQEKVQDKGQNKQNKDQYKQPSGGKEKAAERH